MTKPTVADIDALLPQTQCGLCGYSGCLPYAKALLHEGAPIHLCPPGGVAGLKALGKLLRHDPTPYIPDMEKKTKSRQIAVIRETECIGCTKCIQACPVDAILGSSKAMHTVILDECTGCELCVAPCPVDCIDMIPVEHSQDKKDLYKKRYLTRQKRLREESLKPPQIADKKAYLEAALLRAKMKNK